MSLTNCLFDNFQKKNNKEVKTRDSIFFTINQNMLFSAFTSVAIILRMALLEVEFLN